MVELSFLFIFGLIIGSFINVLVYRSIHQEDSKNLFSICPKCKHSLSPLDLVPLLSFLILKAKCRYCDKPISWSYFVGELSTSLLFVLVGSYYLNDPIALVYSLIIVSLLIALLFTDLYYGILPDRLILSGVVTSGLFLVTTALYRGDILSLLGNVLSAVASFIFFFLFIYFSKGKAMGGGDAKLGFWLGLFLGFPGTLVALFIAFLTGGLIGVMLILTKTRRFGQTVPFGPFLVIGSLIAYLWGNQIFNWYLNLTAK